MIAAALAMVVHLGALSNDFTRDGQFLTRDDPGIHKLSNLPQRLLEPSWHGSTQREVGAWRPVATATYAMIWGVAGDSPATFHGVSIVMHGAVTALVVLLLAQLASPAIAFVGGLVFAIHPVHSEVIANVPGMSELWAAMFALGACLLHLRGKTSYGLGRAVAVTFLFCLAVLSKEGAAILPALLFLLDAARQELTPKDVPQYLWSRGPLYGLMAAAFGLIFVARLGVLGTLASTPPPFGMDLLAEIPRFWTVTQAWTHYVRLMVFPLDLSIDYGPGIIPVVFGWTFLGLSGVALAILAFSGAGITWRRGAALREGSTSIRLVGLGVLWAAVAVLPVANLLYLSPVIVTERSLYLPSVGAALIAAWVLTRLEALRPRVGVTCGLVVVLAGGIRSATRMPDWRDNETLSTSLLEHFPESGLGWQQLGEHYLSRDEVTRGLRAYQVSVGLVGLRWDHSLSLGQHLYRLGRLEPALYFLRRSWEERPDQYQAPTLVSDAARRLGRLGEATAAARAATLLAPENASTHHLLAQALSADGRPRQAVAARRRALAAGYAAPGRQWLHAAADFITMGDTVAALAAIDSASVVANGDAILTADVDSLRTTLSVGR